QGRDLSSDEPAHRARRGNSDDLVGAAGTARHERPHPRDASGTPSGRTCCRGCHRGARVERGTGTCELNVPARQFGTLVGLIALCAVLWILTPHFMTVSNLLNVAEQTSINAIVAVGMTFVILSGGIDLSVGSLVALAGVILGVALRDGQPLALALTAALAAGVVCGLGNG